MAAEETVAAAEKVMATVPDKGKKIADAASEEKDFNLRNLVGQELSEAAEEMAAAAEKVMATVPDKGKKIVDSALEEKDFDLRNLVGQELFEAKKELGIWYILWLPARGSALWWNR